MRIGVIIGSIRRGRKGTQVGQWIVEQSAVAPAALEAGAEFTILDLADFDLPFFTDDVHPAMANKSYDDPRVQRWSDAVDSFDGYIFVTPEYNHSVPGAMKNAFDMLFSEWKNKPVAMASYGAGGGIRAAEHWRAIVANTFMFDTRTQLTVFLETDFSDGTFTPHPQLVANLDGLVGELTSLIGMTKTLQHTA